MPTSPRRSNRKRKPLDRFLNEIEEKRGEITFHTDEQRGLDQPNAFRIEKDPRLDKGNLLWKELKKKHHWQYRAAAGLESSWVYLAPHFTVHDATLGVTKFETLEQMGEQVIRDGDDGQKIVKRAKKAWADKQKENMQEEDEEEEGSEEETEENGTRKIKEEAKMEEEEGQEEANADAPPEGVVVIDVDSDEEQVNIKMDNHVSSSNGVKIVEKWLRDNAPLIAAQDLHAYAQALNKEKFNCEEKILKYLAMEDLDEMKDVIGKADRKYLMDVIESIKKDRAEG